MDVLQHNTDGLTISGVAGRRGVVWKPRAAQSKRWQDGGFKLAF